MLRMARDSQSKLAMQEMGKPSVAVAASANNDDAKFISNSMANPAAEGDKASRGDP
jgi:hypothetical protein